MKASELRIGNFIENTDSQMASYMVVNADVIKQNEHTMYSSLEPISLTEKWLLKFGFVFDINLWHNRIALYPQKNGFSYNVNFFEHENLEDVLFVHTLQNLYFALTGEELTIKQQEQ